MMNITGIYKKVGYNANNLKLRSILSFFTIGIFIFFGFASIEENPDLDCEFYNPPIVITQNITIEIIDKQTGKPITNQTIEFFIIEHEKAVNSNFDCLLKEKKSYSKILNFGSTGKATLTLNKTYISKEDDIIIFFTFINSSYEDILKRFEIRNYHSNLTLRFGYLKLNEYP